MNLLIAQVLVRDPMHEFVEPLVEEFQKQLARGGRDTLGQERSEGHNDNYIPESDGMYPFNDAFLTHMVEFKLGKSMLLCIAVH